MFRAGHVVDNNNSHRWSSCDATVSDLIGLDHPNPVFMNQCKLRVRVSVHVRHATFAVIHRDKVRVSLP